MLKLKGWKIKELPSYPGWRESLPWGTIVLDIRNDGFSRVAIPSFEAARALKNLIKKGQILVLEYPLSVSDGTEICKHILLSKEEAIALWKYISEEYFCAGWMEFSVERLVRVLNDIL